MTQAGSTLDLCSGYLNFTDEFSRLLLESEGELSVTTASPEVFLFLVIFLVFIFVGKWIF